MSKLLNHGIVSRFNNVIIRRSSTLGYVQGQSPEPRVREYFYYIDHQGQLFLDDARIKNFTSCFKEKQFLEFFFTRVQKNTSGRYVEDFPFLSLCGRERNFIRCDDVPIVFTELLPPSQSASDTRENPQRNTRSGIRIDPSQERLSYCCAGHALVYPFLPSEISMLPSTGRVYHPGPEKAGGVGLVKSALAIELSKQFEFKNGEGHPPTHFRWKGETFTLTNNVLKNLELLNEKT